MANDAKITARPGGLVDICATAARVFGTYQRFFDSTKLYAITARTIRLSRCVQRSMIALRCCRNVGKSRSGLCHLLGCVGIFFTTIAGRAT